MILHIIMSFVGAFNYQIDIKIIKNYELLFWEPSGFFLRLDLSACKKQRIPKIRDIQIILRVDRLCFVV